MKWYDEEGEANLFPIYRTKRPDVTLLTLTSNEIKLFDPFLPPE